MDLTPAGENKLREMMKEHGAEKGEAIFKEMIASGAKEAQGWVKKPEKKSNTIMGDRNMNNTAAGIRKRQGPGFWQADIGE
jgi:hypothetical protein